MIHVLSFFVFTVLCLVLGQVPEIVAKRINDNKEDVKIYLTSAVIFISLVAITAAALIVYNVYLLLYF